MWDDPSTPRGPRQPNQPQSPYGPYSRYGQGESGGPDNVPEQPYPESSGYSSGGYGEQESGYGQPPPYQPAPPQYPSGRPPQWPTPGAGQFPSPGSTSPYPTPGFAPPQGDYGASAGYAPAAPPRRVAVEHRERPRRAPAGISLPHLPIAHILLVAGLAAMLYAITQPWGVDAHGAQIFVKDFTSTKLDKAGLNTTSLAMNAAEVIVGAAAVLSVALILFNTVVTLLNRILGIVGLSGCASLLFFPVLWGMATLLFVVLLVGAGFAGLGALSQLPIVRSHAFSDVTVQQNAIGFYIWCGGIGANFIGMLGQLVLRRR